MSYIIQTHGLTKAFDGKETVSNVNIHVKYNQIYGFLGPNGAGKTTVMKMLVNLLKPTGGEIELFGERLTHKSYNVLKRMNSILEFPVFYDHMSGRENLELHREYMGYYSPNCVENALDALDLGSAGNKPVRNYSLGMKQRLGLARAILSKPELLVLDEPTNGLDPAGIKQIRDFLHMLCKEYGTTIMISSHILSEVESLADTVGLLNHGKLVKELPMWEIQEMNLSYVELVTNDVKRAAYTITDHLHITNFKAMDGKTIRIYDQTTPVEELSRQLVLNDVSIESLSKRNESLEDFFLKMTEGGK